MDRPRTARSTAEMPDPRSPAVDLAPYQCWTRLRTSRTGRIVTLHDGRIEVRPLNYVADGHSIVVETSSEVVLAAAADRRPVVFEVDEHDGWSVWSVVVRGTASVMDDSEPMDGAHLRSMLAVTDGTRIRIHPDEVTGRLFDQAP
jgi:nitroimidazol reductase NimA-like FMN-containing flavoprotein (pyridoxamine 5'-phosphate oxidase superfamily)